MSTDREQPGGKQLAEDVLAEAKRLQEDALAEEEQLSLLEPISAEEMAEAHEALGGEAGPLAVLRHAREKRKGRPRGSRNRRTDNFQRYLSQFGPDPAVALMMIIADSEEAMVERSRAMDPVKRQLSYGDARQFRMRAAEGLMPYWHGKQPVRVDATIRGVHLHEHIGDVDRGAATIDGEIIGVALQQDDGE